MNPRIRMSDLGLDENRVRIALAALSELEALGCDFLTVQGSYRDDDGTVTIRRRSFQLSKMR